ncbi:MAG: class I SAM-dependent methyltransferase [Lentisphaerae bacterium]|nr:class I SAM-dependent methyltransferase [Lentisphaerota bacterium]
MEPEPSYDEKVARIKEHFHILYYHSPTYQSTTTWLGAITQKCPLDLWIYQEILHECRPDVIVECGTYGGGSALYMAGVCDALKRGRIVSIDIQLFVKPWPRHERIRYLIGSTIDATTLEKIKGLIQPGEAVMVILDSDHHKDHVLRELRLYSKLVTNGQYLIVEDTQLNGHPVAEDFGPGPMEALEEFLKENDEFQTDREREKFLLTFNPKGYLRKKG